MKKNWKNKIKQWNTKNKKKTKMLHVKLIIDVFGTIQTKLILWYRYFDVDFVSENGIIKFIKIIPLMLMFPSSNGSLTCWCWYCHSRSNLGRSTSQTSWISSTSIKVAAQCHPGISQLLLIIKKHPSTGISIFFFLKVNWGKYGCIKIHSPQLTSIV